VALSTRSNLFEAVVVNQNNGTRLRPPPDFIPRGVTFVGDVMVLFGATLVEVGRTSATTGDYLADVAGQPRLHDEPTPPGDNVAFVTPNQTFELVHVVARPAVSIRREARWEVVATDVDEGESAILAAQFPGGDSDFVAEVLVADDTPEPMHLSHYRFGSLGLERMPSDELATVRLSHQRVAQSASSDSRSWLLIAGPQEFEVVGVDRTAGVHRVGRAMKPTEMRGHVVGFQPRSDGADVITQRGRRLTRVQFAPDGVVSHRSTAENPGFAVAPGLSIKPEGV
jgi:hypothetical protein